MKQHNCPRCLDNPGTQGQCVDRNPATVGMSKHTPGPWEFSKTAHGEAGISILHTDRSSSDEWVKWEMARVGLNSKQITPEAEANARLIAAAPELHEAAVIALFVLVNMTLVPTVDDGGEGHRAFVKAQGLLLNALEKVEGTNK